MCFYFIQTLLPIQRFHVMQNSFHQCIQSDIYLSLACYVYLLRNNESILHFFCLLNSFKALISKAPECTKLASLVSSHNNMWIQPVSKRLRDSIIFSFSFTGKGVNDVTKLTHIALFLFSSKQAVTTKCEMRGPNMVIDMFLFFLKNESR